MKDTYRSRHLAALELIYVYRAVARSAYTRTWHHRTVGVGRAIYPQNVYVRSVCVQRRLLSQVPKSAVRSDKDKQHIRTERKKLTIKPVRQST